MASLMSTIICSDFVHIFMEVLTMSLMSYFTSPASSDGPCLIAPIPVITEAHSTIATLGTEIHDF